MQGACTPPITESCSDRPMVRDSRALGGPSRVSPKEVIFLLLRSTSGETSQTFSTKIPIYLFSDFLSLSSSYEIISIHLEVFTHVF